MEDYPLVIVTWLDHVGDTGWKSKLDVEKTTPAKATTIGWLIHEDRETIKICNSLVDDGDFGGTDCILKRCIVERFEVEVK